MQAPRTTVSRRFPLLGERTDGLVSLGGKAEALNRLSARGCRIPPAFVLPSHLYGEAMEDADVSAAVLRLSKWLEADTEAPLEVARQELNAIHRLETLLEDELGDAAARLSRRAERFAVRSSATGEDGALHSFAGVLTTVLDVPREDLAAAVLLCWSAAKTLRFREYCDHIGMQPSLVSMAVLVQPMIPARCAGVLLTHDPVSGEPGPVVEAVVGQGNKLVSGDVEPQGYRRRPNGLWIRSGGSDPVLTPRDLYALRRLSDTVLRYEGTPQDLEWAFESNKLWLLQARPITTLPQPRSLWTRANLRELYPEVPSPMAASLLQRFRKYRLTEHLADNGLRLWHEGPWLRIINGRPYLNQTLLEALAGAAGCDSQAVSKSIGGVDAEAAEKRKGRWQWRKSLRNSGPLCRLFYGYLTSPQRGPQLLRTFTRRSRELDRRDLDTATDQQLFTTILAIVRETNAIDDMAGDTMGGIEIFRMAAERLLNDHVASALQFLAATTVSNHDNVTARQVRDTQRLAQILREDPRALELFLAAEPGSGEAGRYEGTRFGEELRLFLERYGSRAIHESDCAVPRLEEDPTPLFQALSAEIERPVSARADIDGKEAAQKAWRDLAGSLPPLERLFPLRIWLLRFLIRRLRTYYALRERIRFTDTLLTRSRRRMELTLGKRWAERGWLNAAADYHWLRVDDVERALAQPTLAETGLLKRRVELWQKRHAEWAAEPMPNLLVEGGERDTVKKEDVSDPAETAETLEGLPISPGKVRGKVTLLGGFSNGDLPERDRILVAPVIGPSWAPLLARAKGVIVESGGMLSHGSILAREYGVPGIANIANATTVFHEGEEIVLDGTTGSIRRIAPSEESPNGA